MKQFGLRTLLLLLLAAVSAIPTFWLALSEAEKWAAHEERTLDAKTRSLARHMADGAQSHINSALQSVELLALHLPAQLDDGSRLQEMLSTHRRSASLRQTSHCFGRRRHPRVLPRGVEARRQSRRHHPR